MKRKSMILTLVFLTAVLSFSGMLNAQEKTKEEKEKEMKEAIDAQKKAMVEQQRAQEELQKLMQEQKIDLEDVMKDARIKMGDPEEFSRAIRIYDGTRNARSNFGDQHYYTTGGTMSGFLIGGDSDRTTWDFTKSIKEATFARDYIFDVEPTVKTVVMSVNGDCKSGDIRIKITMPNNKVYSDIVIDEFGNLNWRKSFNISDTENTDKAGAWKFEIDASKATGYFKISLQTY
jgi:hypothetical protein